MPVQAPYGSWKSPISAELLATGGVRPGEVRTSRGDLYWVEQRPAEAGRSVVVRRSQGTTEDVTPPGFDARTRVHEYGGGAYGVDASTVWFTNFTDQRVYRQVVGGTPRPITPEPEKPAALRYADFEISPGAEAIYCVRESHTDQDGVRNELVLLSADGSQPERVLVTGHDFVSFPRLSPDGSRLAFTSWEHPRMPWDGTDLWVADVEPEGGLGTPCHVAGGPEESIFQPAWSPDGVLHFVSDRSGWWNLYRARKEAVEGEEEAAEGEEGASEPLAPRDAEFGRAQWGLAMATYAFLPDGRGGPGRGGRLVCTWSDKGSEHLGVLDSASGRIDEVETPYESFGRIDVLDASHIVTVAASPVEAAAVVQIDVDSAHVEVVKRSREQAFDPDCLSRPESLEFPCEEGSAFALYYAPRNPDFEAPANERPPLLVMSHGGPTAGASAALNPAIQYWTSRGIAVVDVDYGGSTGYGRAYRNRLRGNWGIVDSRDCIAAARALCERDRVDPARLAIRGGSAGGYTTLCALVFHDVFAAGASYYGVADAEALATDTHKFEARYLDSLIGPYPETRERYRERSPIHFAQHLSCPLLILQGLEDRIVPPAQAEVMVEALQKRGLPHAYLAFEGEQHGFRRAETIVRAQEAELGFYGVIFGFEPADEIAELVIANL